MLKKVRFCKQINRQSKSSFLPFSLSLLTQEQKIKLNFNWGKIRSNANEEAKEEKRSIYRQHKKGGKTLQREGFLPFFASSSLIQGVQGEEGLSRNFQ